MSGVGPRQLADSRRGSRHQFTRRFPGRTPRLPRGTPPPPATLALFLVTVTTYLVQVLAGGDVVQRAVGLIPARVSNSTLLMAIGGGQLVPAWLTLVTYMFPHKAWWHV